jgi:hypothetical protein
MSQFKKYLQIINEIRMYGDKKTQPEMMPPSNKKQTAQGTYHYEYSTDGEKFVEITNEIIKSHLDSAFNFDPKRFLKNIFDLFTDKNFTNYIKTQTKEIISINDNEDIKKDENYFHLPLESGKKLIIRKVEEM